LFWVCATRERRKSFTISHDDETTRYLHMMSETFYDNLPAWCRPKRGVSQRGMALEFANPTKDAEKKQKDPGLQSWLRTVSLKNAGAGQGACRALSLLGAGAACCFTVWRRLEVCQR
jgi:hypothetical protein